jgi:hypothetical protein
MLLFPRNILFGPTLFSSRATVTNQTQFALAARYDYDDAFFVAKIPKLKIRA